MTPAEKADFDRWAATVPVGDEDMSPEQQVELAEIVAELETGRARMVPHADVPGVLEAMTRSRAA